MNQVGAHKMWHARTLINSQVPQLRDLQDHLDLDVPISWNRAV